MVPGRRNDNVETKRTRTDKKRRANPSRQCLDDDSNIDFEGKAKREGKNQVCKREKADLIRV
jgi:hypothetical protein